MGNALQQLGDEGGCQFHDSHGTIPVSLLGTDLPSTAEKQCHTLSREHRTLKPNPSPNVSFGAPQHPASRSKALGARTAKGNRTGTVSATPRARSLKDTPATSPATTTTAGAK